MAEENVSAAGRAGYLVRRAITVLNTNRELAQRCLSDAATLLGVETLESDLGRHTTQDTFRSGLARWQARRVLTHIDLNLASKLTVAALADLVALSNSHFSRAFRHALGFPPMAYVAARRVERAKQMMTSTVQPLCMIALACGFTDQPHFNRCFRRWAGVSPGAWRRYNRSDE
jgi:AraC family transcriptional regulator